MLIDSHCHLIDDKYEKSIPEIIKNAKENGIEKIITIGTSLEENEKTIELTKNNDEVYCALGIYPHEEAGADVYELTEKLKGQLTSSKKVVAIGETGLDITEHEGSRPTEEQLELLDLQLKLAKELDLPVIIHNRNADELMLGALKPYIPQVTGVFHCFTQDWEYAKKVLDLGFHISFTGIITYPKNEVLRDVVKNIPENRAMVETDSPWLPPQDYRGQINYPEYVKIVAEKIAQVKQKPIETIQEVLYENTCAFFGIK